MQYFEPTPGWIYRSYPFIDWDDDQYQEFMVRLLRSLEIRQFQPNQFILGELEECLEILFVEEGRYNIGFEVNKHKKFRLVFGERTVIGGFNISFNQRSYFIYKSATFMKCMAIRKIHWLKLLTDFP
jgi:hypothetical protein